MELTDEQNELLKKLTDLVVYGQSQISKTELKRKYTTIRKKMLFFMFGATQSYVESILKIISPTKRYPSVYANSSLVLFRSITENLINVGWIYACDSQKNAAIFSVDWIQSSLKYANRYKDLMIKYNKDEYPTWDLTFGDKKKAKDWDEYIAILKKNIIRDQKRYKLPFDSELPKIEQRCMQHDAYLKSKGELNQGNSLEKLYVTYYPYFSGIAHLTSQGLDTFRDRQTDSPSIDSNPKEIEVLVPIIYAVYFSLLKFFLKKFGVYDRVGMKGYGAIAKSMAS